MDRSDESLFDLQDRVVILTGASSGIGEMLAHGLARQGVRLLLAARRKDLLNKLAEDVDALAVPCDVTVDEDRDRLVHEALSAFGRIDGLVNNAGVSGSGLPALRQDLEEFRYVLDVDLVAPFDLAKHCVPSFRENGGGSIVNITSTAAISAPGMYMPLAAYAAAKAGLAHLTRELALEWGRYNVRVNAIAPGFFPTEINVGRTDGKPFDWMSVRMPLDRAGSSNDIVGLTQFLLSDASQYLTGQQIALDGGFTVG